MRKIRIITVATLVLALAFSTVAFAAPSPVAGTVTVVSPGSGKPSNVNLTKPTEQQLEALASFITDVAKEMGMIPSVKATIGIEAPADYKGGDIPVVIAVSGLANGAQNVFALIVLPNGKKVMVPCTVRNGYVGFNAPALGTVSIVEMNSAGAPAGTVPSKLH